MDLWQRNIRMIHQVGEFLDLDSTSESDPVTELIGLIDAMREGLTQIDDTLCIPDAQINMLLLTKLKSRPLWADWATAMMTDGRPCAADRLTFREMADRAVAREKELKGIPTSEKTPEKRSKGHTRRETRSGGGGGGGSSGGRPRTLTQDDINAFVVRQMGRDGEPVRRSHTVKGHQKRPSQEEINEYVVQQMRRDQEGKTRMRSYSQPEPRKQPQSQETQKRRSTTRCTFCGDSYHQIGNCWRRWRVAVEAPPGDFPKRVEFKSQVPGQPPTYRTGFMLY